MNIKGKGEARRELQQTEDFMADLGWWKWFVEYGGVTERESNGPFLPRCGTVPEQDIASRRFV